MGQLMVRENKAHTATVRRIAARYGGQLSDGDGPDIQTASLTIEVETNASIHEGIRNLELVDGPVYIAVTNKEAIPDAMRLTDETQIGIMDPQGNILRESSA